MQLKAFIQVQFINSDHIGENEFKWIVEGKNKNP
jgi:hypothetical protein